MAKTFGESGRYTVQAAVQQRRRTLMIGFLIFGLLGVVGGAALSRLWPALRPPIWMNAVVPLLAVSLLLAIKKWGLPMMDKSEAERMRWQRGAQGETLVGNVIAEFPDGFHVINDVSTPQGNLDHVVVGPTGVFVLDAKNWRGIISADGQGELLLNGKATDKAYVRQFVGRIMGVKERVRALAPEVDPYFQALFVFTGARVEAPWGRTGSVHCLREDQLWHYIVEKDFGKRLTSTEVRVIAQAFLGLAHMERDFTEKATGAELHPRPVATG